MTERQFKRGDVFIIVFAVDNFDSCEVATDYINKIGLAKDISNPTIYIIVMVAIDKRKVDLHFAKHQAEACNIPFFQASSKVCSNVDEIFFCATALARRQEVTYKQDDPKDGKLDDPKQCCCKHFQFFSSFFFAS